MGMDILIIIQLKIIYPLVHYTSTRSTIKTIDHIKIDQVISSKMVHVLLSTGLTDVRYSKQFLQWELHNK